MSFGGVRIKPDSLQLSVVGYDDNDDQMVESRSHTHKKMELDDHDAFVTVRVSGSQKSRSFKTHFNFVFIVCQHF